MFCNWESCQLIVSFKFGQLQVGKTVVKQLTQLSEGANKCDKGEILHIENFELSGCLVYGVRVAAVSTERRLI